MSHAWELKAGHNPVGWAFSVECGALAIKPMTFDLRLLFDLNRGRGSFVHT
jgi:hypothetical protein